MADPSAERRRIVTPWDAAPTLTAIPTHTPRSPIMARYKDRPEKRAAIEANVRAWKRLKRASHGLSAYGGPAAGATDRSLERTDKLRSWGQS